MSIKARIRAFQIAVALAAAAMAATILFNIHVSNLSLERGRWARQQLGASLQVAVAANRYSEQIAELLLIGEPERPDFDSARAQLSQAFMVLRQMTWREAAALDPREREDERIELERINRMEALLGELDRAVERLLLLQQQGRPADAISLFRTDVENRLDAEFEKLIAEMVADERKELSAIEADAARLSQQLMLTTLVALAFLLAMTLGSGVAFARSLERPIKALTQGALAVQQGDLNHRIGYRGRDELGLLAERFNAMTEELERQRARLVGAQSELEHQVAKRTSELAEANQRLTSADQHRIRFLADISHELRTPLTALRGEAEVALRGSSKPEAVYQHALAAIVARTADIGRLVEDLLFLARSEGDEIHFVMRPVELADVAAKAASDAQALAREHRVRVNLRVENEASAIVRGDAHRLKQALLIPLDNAIKYSDPDTQVDVIIQMPSNPDQVVEIAICDQGPGISPEDLTRIFERFYRGANARARWDGGSGLGLPIARWIVEKHGGTIDVSSVPGQGSAVRICLPATR